MNEQKNNVVRIYELTFGIVEPNPIGIAIGGESTIYITTLLDVVGKFVKISVNGFGAVPLNPGLSVQ